MSLIEYILSTVAPHHCLGCEAEGSILCDNCSRLLPAIPSRCYRCQQNSSEFRTCRSCRSSSPLFSVRPATEYDGLAKTLVQKLKYERLRGGAQTISAHIAAKSKLRGQAYIITHVPTASSRIRQRGYDQAALIARQLASLLDVEYSPLLARVGQQKQVGKTRAERRSQMQTLFLPLKQITEKRVVLVDDVITTGATLEACARTLKAAGAKRVSALVFAAA